MAETLESFFTALCRRMGWESTEWRINVLKTMAQMEGYPSVIQLEQTWNPLDTMHPAGAVGNWNAAGVKIYPNLAAGVEATARTLEQSNFTNLRETFRTEEVNQGTAADLRLWGWNSPNLLNTILSAMGGAATAAQQVTAAGGVAMAGETTTGEQTQTTDIQRQILDLVAKAQALMDTGKASDAIMAESIMSSAASLARVFGVGGAEALQAPSPQEVAIGQQTLDIALANAQANIKEIGLGAAAKQFANDISALQEGRATAEYAQEYARGIAPPGMTTVPFTGPTSAVGQLQTQIGMTPSPAIPLPRAPATDPYQALGQAQQLVQQSPNLQFQAPALPSQAPNLAQLSGFPQQMPVGGAALPIGDETDFAARVASLREAMRMLFGQVGVSQPGAQLPIGAQ